MIEVISGIGRVVVLLISYIGGVSNLFLNTLHGLFTKGSSRRFGWVFFQVFHIGVRSLGVSSLILFLLGMVIALQTAYQMRSLGVEQMIPGLVAVSMLRELGPVMTALVVAGRSGAAVTAQVGTMVVTEQVDALKSMSVTPTEHIVIPRFIAILIVMPILTLYGDFIGILGGFVICVSKLGISPESFLNEAFRVAVLSDLLTGLTKSFFFGALICMISCFEGLSVKGGAQGVGLATMKCVVVSFIAITLTDFLFTALFYTLPF